MPIERRIALWEQLATDLRPLHLDDVIAEEIGLEDAPEALAKIVKGAVRGRTVVRIAS